MTTIRRTFFFTILCLLIFASFAAAQSRRNARGNDVDGTILTVTATRSDKKTEAIKLEDLFLYENGVEQKIKNLVSIPIHS